MPTVEEDLAEGLSITKDSGKVICKRTFLTKDLLLPTGQTQEVFRFATATSLVGIPADGSQIVINGHLLTARKFDLEPLPPTDAIVRVTYIDDPLTIYVPGWPTGPTSISGGTFAVQDQTAFDRANLDKPWDQRKPIFVGYDPGTADAPYEGRTREGLKNPDQGGTVPFFKNNSEINYERFERDEPSAKSRQFSSMVNATTWKGVPAGVALCLRITFDNSGIADLPWRVSYSFAFDFDDKWKKWMQYIDPPTGRAPAITALMVKNQNGITGPIVVQGEENFNELDL